MNEQSFVSVCFGCCLIIGNILRLICEVILLFVLECDLIYEDFEGFFSFQDMQVDVTFADISLISSAMS
jgi:hypothetical protein